MIGDMDAAVHLLSYFHLRFIPPGEGTINPRISFLPEVTVTHVENQYTNAGLMRDYLIEWKLDYFDELPDSVRSQLIPIHAVMFTQGINEHQTVAIRLGETKLQENINLENISILQNFYNMWLSFQTAAKPNQDNSELSAIISKVDSLLPVQFGQN